MREEAFTIRTSPYAFDCLPKPGTQSFANQTKANPIPVIQGLCIETVGSCLIRNREISTIQCTHYRCIQRDALNRAYLSAELSSL